MSLHSFSPSLPGEGGGGRSSSDHRPLPPGWKRGYSRTHNNKPYYVCETTNHTQWHFPTDDDQYDPRGAKRRVEDTMRSERRSNAAAATASSSPSSSYSHSLKKAKTLASSSSSSSSPSSGGGGGSTASGTSVAIIVPYRDLHPAQNRARHLRQFVPHMLRFLSKLKKQGLVRAYRIYIVEQSDDGRKFNRGKLLNIGYEIAKRDTALGHDVFIFHDVDLLPGDDLGGWYAKYPTKPLHIARVWGRYSNNPKYFGGIVSFSSEDMVRINGYPNTFWGWGGEDDEMQKRCEKTNLKWESPRKGTIRDLEEMTLEEKLAFLRKNKKWKCMVKWEALQEHDTTWSTNGLADLTYDLLDSVPLDGAPSVDESRAIKLAVDVGLNGNHWGNAKCGVDYMGG